MGLRKTTPVKSTSRRGAGVWVFMSWGDVGRQAAGPRRLGRVPSAQRMSAAPHAAQRPSETRAEMFTTEFATA